MEDIFEMIVYNPALHKLSLAAAAGLIIGLERELKGKPLGLKTCLIVAVTACLLTIVSYESAFLFSEAYSRPMDPGRIPSYVISGIGFLGAGVILRRNNDAISGLTTASLVLASAGLGITIGVGFYVEALLGVFFMILGVRIIPDLMSWIGPKKLKNIEVRAKIYIKKDTDLTSFLKEVKNKNFGIRRVKVKEEAEDIIISCIVVTSRDVYTTDVYYALKSSENVLQVEVENIT
ncbi:MULTISPECIES: MgtC/SapB family protein [Alkalihalophilus]|uniref:MgtC/SapB transporter n=2 Tax=Alkalihalophilus pseudofirmus TaxID=79885 RepID=D3FXY1_ALKPO|nr:MULTISPECIES: MgtC/SapB family protein [Alkalihalophilus]ADC50740.1 MgtC/SapB transporter [Alkalihalophilus pseudofirmus OF4]MDV2883938.1 MgtC/SapB family protein [Alkalihalophilus pseudofirmus]MEC2070430.1 MgtC/SapB family protein [Alkalihalophilus marmarensis]MED1602515.1 MgtC/SapB family protein [Alkalihalophilus marmarensis]